jgi:polar amino acid transport system substrate-binding protein
MEADMKKILMAGAALGVVALVVGPGASLVTNAQSMGKYGDCKVDGKMGINKFTPALKGQLTVEVSLPAPVFYNGDTPETIKSGLEYCLAANIAHRAGLEKVVVKNVAWDALVAGQTKDFDLALSQISITDERKKVVEFSTPYFFSDVGVLAKKGAKLDGTSIKAATIGVQQGTTGEYFAQNSLKPKNLKVFPDTPSMFTALQAGQIDAAMTDTAIVLGQAKATDGALAVVGQFKTGETYGALFPKASKNRATINAIIAALIKDGTIKKLSKEYFGGDPSEIPFFKL